MRGYNYRFLDSVKNVMKWCGETLCAEKSIEGWEVSISIQKGEGLMHWLLDRLWC